MAATASTKPTHFNLPDQPECIEMKHHRSKKECNDAQTPGSQDTLFVSRDLVLLNIFHLLSPVMGIYRVCVVAFVICGIRLVFLLLVLLGCFVRWFTPMNRGVRTAMLVCSPFFGPRHLFGPSRAYGLGTLCGIHSVTNFCMPSRTSRIVTDFFGIRLPFS